MKRVSNFNQTARKACSQCGAPVRWTDAAGAEAHGMKASEAAEYMGYPVEALDFWVCTECDESGAFGPATAGGF